MCNAYNLKTNLTTIAEAAERGLGLPLVFSAGVTGQTSNLPVPQSIYPRRDGLILRPHDPAEPGIIPVSSFTEWTGPKGSKTAHAISRADGGLLFLAGLWERCPTEEGLAESYTMPMIDAANGDDVAPFHNRQPVTLDAASAALWLDLNADPRPMLRAPPPGTLIAEPPRPVVS